MNGFWPPTAPGSPRYLLRNLRIPPDLCGLKPAANGWCQADVLINGRHIETVSQAGEITAENTACIDADNSILISAPVDCHTHLDKAHVAAFQDFPAGDLLGAIDAMAAQKKTWTQETLTRRVEFSLRSAYAFGLRALRSHVDYDNAPEFVWQVLDDAALRWRDRIALQLLPLVNISALAEPQDRRAYYQRAQHYGRLGLFLYDQPDMEALLTPVFQHAKTQGWDIDLHVDEGLDPTLDGLDTVARVTLATGFTGTVLCSHCVALNSYDAVRRERVIAHARKAGLDFVSLPVTNLYLQGRNSNGVPQTRGMMPVRALKEAGAMVSMGADNVQDGFCAFGDFDPMAVLNIGAQVGHLDNPARDWAALITCNPARTMGLEWDGVIRDGAPADLVLFAARTSGELSSRITPERIVIREGNWLVLKAPDFREL
ncbi:MAG: amidohydrolase family protein [Rhodobacteraceae bacterium]|nr:amidohydrolase family protein [Paracoccaceae bacterium]